MEPSCSASHAVERGDSHSTTLHGFGGSSATSLSRDHLCFVLKTHLQCSPGGFRAACNQISQTGTSFVPWVWCLALADNPEHGHLLWQTVDTGCSQLSLPRPPHLQMDRRYLPLLCVSQPPCDCHHTVVLRPGNCSSRSCSPSFTSGVSILGITGVFFLPATPSWLPLWAIA